MNILRQNTDYALQMMGNLAAHYDEGAVSVRVLAQDEEVSYQFACKILQKLHDARLVESVMGPKGGYRLCRDPEQITILEVVGAMQGELAVNRCTNSNDGCARKAKCPLNGQLCELQYMVDNFMAGVTLQRLRKFKISESE